MNKNLDLPIKNEIAFTKQVAVIGGTFDALHLGHKEYINIAFEFAKKVHIFLRTNGNAQNSKEYTVKPYHVRRNKVENYIEEIGCKNRYSIHKMDSERSLFEFCLNHDEISLAVLVPEYYRLFEEINKMREQKGLKSLLILIKQRTRTPEGIDLNSTYLDVNNRHKTALEMSSNIQSSIQNSDYHLR